MHNITSSARCFVAHRNKKCPLVGLTNSIRAFAAIKHESLLVEKKQLYPKARVIQRHYDHVLQVGGGGGGGSSHQLHTSAATFSTTYHYTTKHNEVSRGSSSRAGKLVLGRHVKEALANGSPIVALESTVITHGLPEPQNFDLAISLESVISNWPKTHLAQQQHDPLSGGGHLNSSLAAVAAAAGVVATPATVGIVRGQIIVGLSRDEIKYLAEKEQSKSIKCSRRDIPIAMALGLSAGTTVSATMAIASSIRATNATTAAAHNDHQRRAGIKVFATGGLGGVHMGGQLSMDISADLYEFARSPIGVVSSGFKSFLDTRRSLEFLETMGATVMSLQDKHDEQAQVNNNNNNNNNNNAQDGGAFFPGFFTRKNKDNIKSPCIVKSIDEAALVLLECLEAPIANRRALLLAVPIPVAFAADCAKNSRQLATNSGLTRAEQDNVVVVDDDDGGESLDQVLANISDQIDKRLDLEGKEKTPLILERLEKVTAGRSLRANIELLKNNALVGAKLAIKYAELINRTGAIQLKTKLPTGGQKEPDYGDDCAGAKTLEEPTTTTTTTNSVGGNHEQNSSKRTSTELGQKAEHDDDDDDDVASDGDQGPVVVGCTMIDMHVSTKIDDHFKNNPSRSGITFQGSPHLTLGGVGQNLATALELLGHRPTFITSLANDNLADFALNQLQTKSCLPSKRLVVNRFLGKQSELNSIVSSDVSLAPSSCFALVLLDSIDGLCEYVVANLSAIQAIDREVIKLNEHKIKHAPLLVMDANLIDESIKLLIDLCWQHRVPIFLEPTDKMALPRLINCFKQLKSDPNKCSTLASLLCLSPNVLELEEIINLFEQDNNQLNETNLKRATSSKTSDKHLEQMANKLMTVHLPHLKCLLVTMDKRGVLVAVRRNSCDRVDVNNINLLKEFHSTQQLDGQVASNSSSICIQHFPPPKLVHKPISASGAGDSFAAGFISGLLNNSTLAVCLSKAFNSSLLALQDRDTISQRLKTLSRDE